VFSNEGSEDIPNAKATFDGREEHLLCEIDITQDMVKKQLNRLRDEIKHLAQMSWYRSF